MAGLKLASGMAAGALLIAAAQSQAAALLSINFNSPKYSNAALNDGTTGQDGWLSTSGAGTNNVTVQNSASDGFVTLDTNGQDLRRPFDGAATVTSGSVYFTADLALSAAQSGDYFMTLQNGSTLYARLYAKTTSGGYLLGIAPGDGTPVYGTTVLTLGQTYGIGVQYDFISGTANDRATVYVSPTVSTTDGLSGTTYATSNTAGSNADASTITSIGLRQGASGSAPTVSLIDNITAASVVPEPASLALFGLAGIGFLRRRRA